VLPDWNSGALDVFEQYCNFFRSWGTHVVKACTFGGRYQLRVEHDMTKGETKQSFGANMRAEYDGVENISGDVSIKGSEEYKSYRAVRSTLACVRGGIPGDSIILSNAPDDLDKYLKVLADWAKGFLVFFLDLSPGGAIVQSSTKDKDPGHTREVEVHGSLCRPLNMK
jgi:MAC/Perforin domain